MQASPWSTLGEPQRHRSTRSSSASGTAPTRPCTRASGCSPAEERSISSSISPRTQSRPTTRIIRDRCARIPALSSPGPARGATSSTRGSARRSSESTSGLEEPFPSSASRPRRSSTPTSSSTISGDATSRNLREQLLEAGSPSERFRLVEAALLRRLRRARPGHPAARAAMDAFRAGGSAVRVAERRDERRAQSPSVHRGLRDGGRLDAETLRPPPTLSRRQTAHRDARRAPVVGDASPSSAATSISPT